MRDSKVTKRAFRLAGLLTAMLIASGLAMSQIAAADTDPLGNNGTIKIDGVPFDDLPNPPDNEPHVGCTFQVDFYGFDEGDLFADVQFVAQPPTGDQELLTDTVFIGEDDNSGGGSTDGLDASKTYTLDLTGITPHPVQGVHVKLTIHADGSQGADTKYKVFWVTGCGETGPTTNTMEETTTTTTTTGGGSSSNLRVTTTSGGAGGEESATSLGKSELPFTGADSLPVLATGLLLLAVGAGGLLISRRMRTR